MNLNREASVARMLASLDGLSVGDAFGERFFLQPDHVRQLVSVRALPAGAWHYTDDTQMALSIVAVLRRTGHVDQEALAKSFAQHYEPSRGYGAAMHGLLTRIRAGEPWANAAADLCDGEGSFGNGAAMRVAPLGAYFAHDLDAVCAEARHSAEITHTNEEAIAGAIAVAVSAALAARSAGQPGVAPSAFLRNLLPLVPESAVREGIARAATDYDEAEPREVAEDLGNGSETSAQDTVPFALWCAARHLGSYVEALWSTVSVLGDIDTNCAIVGGIVASHGGAGSVPAEWIDRREPLPNWSLA